MPRGPPITSLLVVGNGSWFPRKAQYERQLTLWKFRKNLTSDEWGFAINRMEKRKREGKENDLFVDGCRIPPKRIKKEISRHRRPNETGMIPS